jgi:hypothetical protein
MRQRQGRRGKVRAVRRGPETVPLTALHPGGKVVCAPGIIAPLPAEQMPAGRQAGRQAGRRIGRRAGRQAGRQQAGR